jgi:hypothetical protein
MQPDNDERRARQPAVPSPECPAKSFKSVTHERNTRTVQSDGPGQDDRVAGMTAAMVEWRRERDRRHERAECACPGCLPYPNAEAAGRWRPGRPIPDGWRYEQGWGLTCTESWQKRSLS